MARTRKKIQPLNLYKYDVLIEDRGPRSDYFKTTQFDGYFYGGRNAFLISGATVLQPGSKLLVEILNVNGETIYSAPISNFVEGSSRLVQIEVYEDTPPGPGKLIILGCTETYLNGKSVPPEWKNKYNIRWITDVTISPRVNNKTPIRFEKNPGITVAEKFYAAPSSSQYIETISLPINVQLSPKYYNVFPNGYIISLSGSSLNNGFEQEYLGGRLTGSFQFTGSSGLEIASVDIPITKIYNRTTAESIANLVYTDKDTLIKSVFISSSGTYTSSINSDTPTVISSNLNLVYSKLETLFTGSGLSFAEIRLVDLETLSGEINKVRLSFKNATNPGEYVLLGDVNTAVKELYAIDSGSSIVNTGNFSQISLKDYWYATTMSLQKDETISSLPAYYQSSSLVTNTLLYKNDNDLLNGISATPSIVNGKFLDNKSYFIGTSNNNTATLFPRSEYTLAFNAFVSSVSSSTTLSQDDSSLEVYLVSQEGTNSKIITTNPRGQLIGTLTPADTFKKQNFERVEFNFVPQIISSGKYGLRFIVYGGHWSIADVSVKVAEEPYFSPDEINVLVPIQNYEQDILTFKAEFLDINNNTAGVAIESTPTYFTGSSDYVKKVGDSMTGELYIKGLPMYQQALEDSFTGLVSGGLITINSPASWSYTISSGSGYVIDNYTDPLNPLYTYVTWPTTTKTPSAFSSVGAVASYPRTNIAISASGQIIEQSSEWTPQDYRKYIILGRIAHVGTTYIQRTLSLPLTTYNRGFHWFDLANAIGVINIEGNIFYPSGSSMSIGKTSGKTYRVGTNYKNDTKYPDITTDPSSLPTSFAYRYRSGSGFAEEPLTTIITGSKYDDGTGILATPNPNKFTVQRIYYFGATNTTRIQFGQNVYNSLAEAAAAFASEDYVGDPNLENDSALRAYLIVGTSTTDLSDAAQAQFVTVGKFSSAVGGGGGGGGAANLSELKDVTLSGLFANQFLQYNGSKWVNGYITASIFGTSSWANNSISSSFATTSSAATSLTFTPLTASFANTASVATSITFIPPTASFATTSSAATSITFTPPTASFSTTASAATSITFVPSTASFAISSSRAVTASFAITSSYIIPSGLPAGTVSSSGQVSYTGLSNIPTGIVSSSTQVTALLPVGTVSSSGQVSYTGLSNVPSGIVSSSTQVTTLLPVGTVSSSLQISTGSFTGSFIGTHSGSTFGTSSWAISASWAPSAGGTVTSITAGSGLSGGTITSTGTISLDTSSAHFTSGIKSKLNTDAVISSSIQINTGSFTGSFVGNVSADLFTASVGILIDASSSTDLVRFTQRGTGNSLLVEDEANPDATPFVITNAGRVGVGVLSPSTQLHVSGSGAAGGWIRAQNSTYNNNITISPSAAGPQISFISASIQMGNIGWSTLYANSGLTLISDYPITIAPTTQLTVAGTVSATSYTSSLNNQVGFLGTSSFAASSSVAVTSSFVTNAASASGQLLSTTGNIQFNSLGIGTPASTTAGEIRATNEITAYYSDERLKNFHGTIENAGSKVALLNGYYFTENDVAKSLGYTNNNMQIGLSAQEVQAVLPEAVVPAPIDDKYLTVKYEKLVPLLIEAIKELQEEIAILKKLR